jgi:hypothetical protein
LQSIGWLGPDDHYRRIGFIISLGAILGAASLDLLLILTQTFRRLLSQRTAPAPPADDWKRVNILRLVLWVAFWGAAVVAIGSSVLHQPVPFLLVAVGLCFLFVLTNGIALGISDFNPISSAFVMSVFLMAAMGLRDPGVGLLCAAILAIATSEGGDMQQDRSTGWRLGTNRIVQFRYQVIGIAAGAVLAVALAKVFMSAYPVLKVDQLANPKAPGIEQWQSAFTYKMVGALRGITNSQPHVMKALAIGIGIGLLIELTRKILKSRPRYQKFTTETAKGRATGFVLDAFLLPSPYAFAFGGFVELNTVLWWSAGGLCSALFELGQKRLSARRREESSTELPPDMSTTSLAGGGLIAGDALASLAIGVSGLLRTVL